MRQNTKRIASGVAAAVTLLAASAPGASAQTLQRQALCDDAEPNAIAQLIPVAVGCENGEYDPATETYKPYDPATDTNGPLGLEGYIGRSILGL